MGSVMNFISVFRIGLLKFHPRRIQRATTVQSSPLLFISKIFTNASIVEFTKRKERFSETFPGIVDSLIPSLVAKELTDNASADFPSWIRKVLNYNVKDGKLLRGLSTVMAYELMEKPENITEESLHLSRVMGWCVEMFQAYTLMQDDIMDGSEKRRGKPCWYTLPHVGVGAINDGLLIYTSMQHLIRTRFGRLPQYCDIIHLFNDTLLMITIGQHLDYTASHQKGKDCTLFTTEQYETIVKYKASYTFELPLCLGILLANKYNAMCLTKEKEICFKLGLMFQMQDDFIDVFELETVTGKSGRDIQDGKCTWLAVNALQRCHDRQKRDFMSSYGISELGHVESIKNLYKELDLPKIYKEEEHKLYDEVVKLVESLDKSSRASELFLTLLDIIHERKQ